jgi:hypothetical protein
MTIFMSHYPDEDRLDLTFTDNLDLTLARQILEACEYVDSHLMTCVIDTTRVVRVFDSGVALLKLLMQKLTQFHVRLVVVGEITGLGLDPLPPTTTQFKPLCGSV